MTAHDDDQDVVTIRVPRRAAAMYAARLDASSSPFIVTLSATSPYFIGLVVALAGLVTACLSLVSIAQGDQDWAIDLGGAASGIGFVIGGLVALRYAKEYRKFLKAEISSKRLQFMPGPLFALPR